LFYLLVSYLLKFFFSSFLFFFIAKFLSFEFFSQISFYFLLSNFLFIVFDLGLYLYVVKESVHNRFPNILKAFFFKNLINAITLVIFLIIIFLLFKNIEFSSLFLFVVSSFLFSNFSFFSYSFRRKEFFHIEAKLNFYLFLSTMIFILPLLIFKIEEIVLYALSLFLSRTFGLILAIKEFKNLFYYSIKKPKFNVDINLLIKEILKFLRKNASVLFLLSLIGNIFLYLDSFLVYYFGLPSNIISSQQLFFRLTLLFLMLNEIITAYFYPLLLKSNKNSSYFYFFSIVLLFFIYSIIFYNFDFSKFFGDVYGSIDNAKPKEVLIFFFKSILLCIGTFLSAKDMHIYRLISILLGIITELVLFFAKRNEISFEDILDIILISNFFAMISMLYIWRIKITK